MVDEPQVAWNADPAFIRDTIGRPMRIRVALVERRDFCLGSVANRIDNQFSMAASRQYLGVGSV
jgi:hypothetical protein